MNRRSFLTQGAAGAAFVMTGRLELFAEIRDNPKLASAGPVVETSAGKIRGSLLEKKIHHFRGIPYGAATGGKNRFMAPTKPAPWTGVRDVTQWGSRAPQIRGTPGLVPEYNVMEYVGPMGEDCLVLNVWTNGINDGRKRPVMVWIHGGGFANGSASVSLYDGMDLAAKHDVVVVSINHRLNIFGFLYLADLSEKYAHSGNAGMQDLVVALEWVRDNIANFGGDPGNVTIFGQSGGGSKVSTLLGMPAAKGLFHRAVAMSGSQVTSGRRSDATESTLAVLKRVNLDKSRLDDLQNVPVDQLLELTVSGGGVRGLGPVVDGYSLPANAFEPVATDISANVPLMIGSNETEATWNANMNYDPLDETGLRNRVKQTLRVDDSGADRVIAVYKKDRPKASNLNLFLIIASDGSNFRTGTDQQAERKAAQGAAPVYRYYFQWYSPVREGKLRSMHTMELGFVFDHVGISKSTIGEGKELQPLADKMSAAWVAFARNGNPNHKGLPNWPKFNLDQKPTMVFNSECKLVNNPYGEEKAVIADATRRKQNS